MARTTALPQSDVFSAIEGLLAAGEYPTAARLRERLDRRGSPVVLQRFLSDWYAEHGADFVLKVERRRQADGGDTIRAQLASATRDALAKFDVQQAERVATLDARATALDQREADLLARDQRLDEREIGQRELIDTLKADRQAALTAQQDARDAAARLQSELEVERQRAATLSAQLENLQRQLARLDEDLHQSTAAGAEQQALVAATQAQLVALLREHAQTQSALTAAQQEFRDFQASAQRERSDARARLDAAAEALKLSEREREEARITHARQQAHAEERVRALQAALDQERQARETSERRQHDNALAMGRLEGTLAQLQRERDAVIVSLQENLLQAVARFIEPGAMERLWNALPPDDVPGLTRRKLREAMRAANLLSQDSGPTK